MCWNTSQKLQTPGLDQAEVRSLRFSLRLQPGLQHGARIRSRAPDSIPGTRYGWWVHGRQATHLPSLTELCPALHHQAKALSHCGP